MQVTIKSQKIFVFPCLGTAPIAFSTLPIRFPSAYPGSRHFLFSYPITRFLVVSRLIFIITFSYPYFFPPLFSADAFVYQNAATEASPRRWAAGGGVNRRISFIIVKGCRRINISTIALAYIFETLRLTLINFSHYRFLQEKWRVESKNWE